MELPEKFNVANCQPTKDKQFQRKTLSFLWASQQLCNQLSFPPNLTTLQHITSAHKQIKQENV